MKYKILNLCENDADIYFDIHIYIYILIILMYVLAGKTLHFSAAGLSEPDIFISYILYGLKYVHKNLFF